MNEVQGVNNYQFKTNNLNNVVNFKAGGTNLSTNTVSPQDTFEKEIQKQRKKAENDRKLNQAVQIGVLGTLLASVGLTAYLYFGKGTPKTVFNKISDKMPSLTDDCVNPKVKATIERFVNILKVPKEVADYTKAAPPRFMIIHGPTGTGKTFSAQLVAKELNAKYGEVQFSDLSSEYVGKTAVNISKKFKEIKKMVNKNPKEQHVLVFNEMDSLLNNVNKLGSNNQHLGQNRTAFLNGLDSVKDCKNLTIIGTTNVKPESGNMDSASIGRAVIMELGLPVKNEAASAFAFQLSRFGGTDNLRNDKEALEKFAQQIVDKKGSNRDIEKIVETATSDFTIDIGNKTNATSEQMTADYIQRAIDKKEVWASGIDDSANGGNIIPQINDSLIAKFWEFIAKQQGAI